MTSEAAEDQGWKREPREEGEAERLLRHKPRWCALCGSFGNHFADTCPEADDESEVIASPEFVSETLYEARSRIGKENRDGN